MPVFHQGFLGCINRMISCTIKYIICYMRGDKGQDEEIEGIIPDYIWKDGLCGAVYGHTGGNPVCAFRWLEEYMHIVYAISILLSAAVIIYIFNEPINSSFKMAWIIPVLVIPCSAYFYTFSYRCSFRPKLWPDVWQHPLPKQDPI